MFKNLTNSKKVNKVILAFIGVLTVVSGFSGVLTVRGQNNGNPNASNGSNTKRTDKVSVELRDHIRKKQANVEEVVIQLNGPVTGQLNALLRRNGVRIKGAFDTIGAISVSLPVNVIDELASFAEVETLTRDRETFATGHVTTTTGTENIRNLPGFSNYGFPVNGEGVGIAILDSGVYLDHVQIKNGGQKSLFNLDFTGEGRIDDPFGHGTHVATAAVGNENLYSATSGSFSGIANYSKIVNLRVLNSQGQGTVTAVLAAADWLLKNGSRYKIRVVNMSLGAPAIESYKNDPLCKAVRRLVDAGFVVVVAAGNDGKQTINGTVNKSYGTIHSPGNEPSAITVGAVNTFGTDDRSDDVVATYSSRGPTRSYYTDIKGVKHYDNLS